MQNEFQEKDYREKPVRHDLIDCVAGACAGVLAGFFL